MKSVKPLSLDMLTITRGDDQTLSDNFRRNRIIRVGGKEINSRAYISRFNFTGADQENLPVYYQVVRETVYIWH